MDFNQAYKKIKDGERNRKKISDQEDKIKIELKNKRFELEKKAKEQKKDSLKMRADKQNQSNFERYLAVLKSSIFH
jgi:hypothetical protein